MDGEKCATEKDCWNTFLERYQKPTAPGKAPLLSFVKFFGAMRELNGKTRQDVIEAKDSYFYQFLKLAGLPDFH